jgi:NADPH2:quinone reductase
MAVNYRLEDFHDVALEFTAGKGVDVVLDIVGGDYIAREIDLLKREGRLVFVALAAGGRAEADFYQVIIKHLTVTGSTLRSRSVLEKARLCAALEQEVWPLFTSKRLTSMVTGTFRLADVAEAHRYLESGAHTGKILLLP